MPAVPPIDEVLNLLPYFGCLRPDERVRVAERMTCVHLAAGESFALSGQRPALVVVAVGELSLTLAGESPGKLFAGDSVNDVEVVAGKGKDGAVAAKSPSVLAVLDRGGLEAIWREFPVMGLPLVSEMGRELKWRNDLLREIVLLRREGLSPEQLAAFLGRRRKRLQRHRRHPIRRTGRLLGRVVIAEPARRPAFWMFAGAALALTSARAVVDMILRKGLQSKMFALIGGAANAHPIHIHHFNYGLLLVSLTGLLSLLPRMRRQLRALSFVFGFGVGLVVDEFALLWNLNPDYYQPSSRLAAAVVLFGLVQVVYFRAFYAAIGRRLWAAVAP